MPLGQDLAPDFTKLARNALTLKSFNHKLNKLINARLKSVSGNHCLETRYVTQNFQALIGFRGADGSVTALVHSTDPGRDDTKSQAATR